MEYSYFSYTRVIAVVALFAGIFLLSPANLFFLNDDFTHLYLTSQGKWLQQNSFRPVCDFSMWLDYRIWGLNALGFHLTNSILHLIATYLVYRLSLSLLAKYHQAGIASSNAILIAAIFFVYAFHAETIYWVIGRSSSLGAIFFLLSCIYYLKRKTSAKHFVLSLLFFGLGLLTYESVWIIPVVFVILSWLDVKHHSTIWKKESTFIITAIIVFIAYFIVRYFFIQQLIAPYEGERFLNFDIAGLTWNYAKLILRSFSKQAGNFYFLGSAFLITLFSIISFLFSRKRQLCIAVVLLWLISYIPYLSLGIDTFGSEGERYLYQPTIFLSIIIGLGIVNAARTYKYIISLLYFFVHILLLNETRKNYEVASAVTKATVQQIRNMGKKDVLYIQQLPQENNGALIFRNGINGAVQLFSNAAVKTVKVISVYEGNFTFFNGVNEQIWMDDLPGNKNKDAVFDFSGNALNVYR